MSLRIKEGNNDIEIMFNYTCDPELGKLTTSIIKLNNKHIGMGQAICSIKDNFCKATGRKISLTRAIEVAKENKKIDKNISKKIWETYRASCK